MRSLRSRAPGALPAEDSASELGSRLFDVLPGGALPRLRGTRTVTASLPSGRTVWLQLRPATASAAELNRLARAVELADARHVFETRSRALAIHRMSRKLSCDAASVERAQLRSKRKLARRVVAGDAKIDARVSRAAAQLRGRNDTAERTLAVIAGRTRRRGIWDSLVLVSAAPLFAAYGDRGRPFGGHNLTLAISLGVWLVGDELVDLIAGEPESRRKILRDADVWSYMAPFANLLAGWWLLDDSQHERFVTDHARLLFVGPSTIVAGGDTSYRYAMQIDVAGSYVALDDGADFASFSRVPALATITTASAAALPAKYEMGPVSAVVEAGLLSLVVDVVGPAPSATLPQPLESIEVAWAVDTREASA
jgi:hypothetical protein